MCVWPQCVRVILFFNCIIGASIYIYIFFPSISTFILNITFGRWWRNDAEKCFEVFVVFFSCEEDFVVVADTLVFFSFFLFVFLLDKYDTDWNCLIFYNATILYYCPVAIYLYVCVSVLVCLCSSALVCVWFSMKLKQNENDFIIFSDGKKQSKL